MIDCAKKTVKKNAHTSGLFTILLVLFGASNAFAKYTDDLLNANKINENAVSIYVDIEDIKLTVEILKVYENKLSTALGQPVFLSRNKREENANIRLTNRKKVNKGWFRSWYLFDRVPGYSMIQLKDFKDIKSPLIGQVRRPYMLNWGDYVLDSQTAGSQMLLNGRIDGLLDYEENESIYYLQNEKFIIRKLTKPTYIYIEFAEQSLASHYDKSVIEIENVTTKNAPAAKKNEAALSNKNVIDWQIIVKHFDKNIGQLAPVKVDLEMTDWLKEKLPEFTFNISTINTSSGFEKVASSNNACILNTLKNGERDKIAHFTTTSFAYLNQRLYTDPQNPNLLSTMSGSGSGNAPLDIVKLFEEDNKALIGFYQYYQARYPKPLLEFITNNPNRFLDIATLETEKSIHLLKQARINYLLEYPSVFRSSLDKASEANHFKSYAIKGMTDKTPSFIGCSKSALGKDVIARINALLKDKQNREELLSIHTQSMTSSASEDMKAFFHSQYSN